MSVDDSMRRTIAEQHDEIGALKAENAKLRELVHIAGTYCANGYCEPADGCPLCLGKSYCAFPERMRELGIEVP